LTRGKPRLIGITLIAALLTTALLALGVWQVQRRAWKHALIAQVEARVHAAPIPAPATATQSDAYLRVRATGRFLHDRATLVQASTERGPGYWVMTPLVMPNGRTLIVNRGYVPDRRVAYTRPAADQTITGLLRLSEPRSGFLRSNDPAADRWYSRDVAAIAKARHLQAVPYFLDQETGLTPEALPVAGLTVLRFPDNHLVYALTWFALAAMAATAYILVMRHERKDRPA
jgi:surfeit locus 1 family protein